MDEEEFEALYAEELEYIKDLEGNEDSENKKPSKIGKTDQHNLEVIKEDGNNDEDMLDEQEFFSLLEKQNELGTKPNQSDILKDISVNSLYKKKETTPATNGEYALKKNSNRVEQEENRNYQLLNVGLLNGKNLKLKFYEDSKTNGNGCTNKTTNKENYFQFTNANILGKSIAKLKLEITNEIVNKCKQNIIEMNNTANDESIINYDTNNDHEHKLWVEKFKPKDYFELLSDDGINRLILTWMKSWDYIVFGKELNKDLIKRSTAMLQAGGGGGGSGANSSPMSKANRSKPGDLSNSGKKRKKSQYNQSEVDFEEKLLELDEFKRPKIKVCLICGPPGLGKTTLAHIIAQRAGYNFIEMNASDDRSAETFKHHIESATQIRGSVNSGNFKPTCLIIDEIDGAPANSIQVLVDHINEGHKGKKKEGFKNSPTLLRPIICICNNLYTPALKQLRQQSIVFQCPPISTHRLAERLYTICLQSHVDTNMDAMISLCDKTNNDIRSCLNTLQFLSKKKTVNKIDSKLINELSIGQKDYEKGIFAIMGAIFFNSPGAMKRKNLEKDGSFNGILNMCQNCDMDRLIQALYENFLSIHFRDTYFEAVTKGMEWLQFYDTQNRHVRSNQEFILLSYQRYIPVLFHILFSTFTQSKNIRLKFPQIHMDFVMNNKKNQSTIDHFIIDMNPTVRTCYNSVRIAILELIPYLNEILQPNLRTVTVQLFNKSEKEKLDNLIQIMILFNLNYRQERGTDGQYCYILEPSIDEITKFTGLKQKKQLAYVIKQQIAREIVVEKVKASDKYKSNSKLANDKIISLNNAKNNIASPASMKIAALFKNKNISSLVASASDNAKNNLKIDLKKDSCNMFQKFFKKEPKPATDFNKEKAEIKKQAADDFKDLTEGIWLKYKEGFINAVRYNVKISKLL